MLCAGAMNVAATPDRDALTGLPGDGAARALLEHWRSAAAGDGVAVDGVHLMMLGLGRFDTVNRAYGEAAGDGALIEIARRIAHFAGDEFEEGDWLAARLGGGTFLLAAREACSRERWQWLAEALADAIAHPIDAGERSGRVRLWPRIALLRALSDDEVDGLFERLATTLERNDGQGASRIEWVDRGLADDSASRTELEADLLTALDGDEIAILFQPQYACDTDALVGAEALARWSHPRLGRIGAGALFAIAERVDQVPQLSRHILQKALEAGRGWPDGLRLSVNVTPADLAIPGFAEEFVRMVGETGFAAQRLTLELTEQVLLGDLERCAAQLTILREAGMKIALDDFGAGFCNFRYLKVLPLDTLKLDRAMVEGIEDSADDLAVLRGIVAMARALGLAVTAEGIETEAQRRIVAEEGCAVYQGFLRAAPMGAEEFARLARGEK